MPSIKSVYPKAFENHPQRDNPALRKTRKPFFKAAATNFLYLQVLFFGLFCYIFGSLFLQTNHIHNLRVIFVDYDGGVIGDAVRNAYASLRGRSFPSLIEQPPSNFPTTASVREAVCSTRYWAAFYITQGASTRLQQALTGGAAASAYDPADVMTYIWNEARYSTTIDSAISFNLQELAEAARVAYSSGNGTGNISSVSGPAALSVFADPWRLQSTNIQPTTQGSRTIYNTLVVIFVLIQEFFYLGTINGLYAQFKVYARADPYRIILVRNVISLCYTFIGSLCVTSALWAFKSGWNVNANQYLLTWMTFWLFANINFLTFDVFTVWLPGPFVPMALVTWIAFNVTSILSPFELSPGFYKIGYIAPAHNLYQTLIDIWSRGCNPKLYYTLPTLFSWLLVSFTLSALGVFRRCHFATIAQEQAEERERRECRERVDAAVAFEMARIKQMKEKRAESLVREPDAEPAETPLEKSTSDDTDGGGLMRHELTHVLDQVNTRQLQEQQMAPKPRTIGPEFRLAFGT